MRLAIAGGTGLIGSQVVAQSRAAGHEAVVLARSEGVDVADLTTLRRALYGADVLIDVTQSPSPEESAARTFFVQTAANLAAAAGSVGVRRTIVMSQVGSDRAADADADPDPGSIDGYLRAKAEHERASRSYGLGDVHVVRSTQTHNFVGQLIGRSVREDIVMVPAVTVQPVEVAFLVATLLEIAIGVRHEKLLEVAGPRREQLDEIASEFLDYYFEPVRVESATASECLRRGILLAGNQAAVGGSSFRQWLRSHPRE